MECSWHEVAACRGRNISAGGEMRNVSVRGRSTESRAPSQTSVRGLAVH
jgi:hypothetical protein